MRNALGSQAVCRLECCRKSKDLRHDLFGDMTGHLRQVCPVPYGPQIVPVCPLCDCVIGFCVVIVATFEGPITLGDVFVGQPLYLCTAPDSLSLDSRTSTLWFCDFDPFDNN